MYILHFFGLSVYHVFCFLKLMKIKTKTVYLFPDTTCFGFNVQAQQIELLGSFLCKIYIFSFADPSNDDCTTNIV